MAGPSGGGGFGGAGGNTGNAAVSVGGNAGENVITGPPVNTEGAIVPPVAVVIAAPAPMRGANAGR